MNHPDQVNTFEGGESAWREGRSFSMDEEKGKRRKLVIVTPVSKGKKRRGKRERSTQLTEDEEQGSFEKKRKVSPLGETRFPDHPKLARGNPPVSSPSRTI